MPFDVFMGQLSATNSTLDFFVDFEKVSKNTNKISIKLNQLNYLIGKENINQAIRSLYKENPDCFSVLNILIAVRNNREIIAPNGDIVFLNTYFSDEDKIIEFINETGIAEILKNKDIKNLVDYVFGIEVGLDTNARKNRGGKNMEKLVASIFKKNNIPFKSEIKSDTFPELLSLGKDIKRFDFVVTTNHKTYLIEVNYYNGGGSKLNETARAYTDIAPKINQYDDFEFVWITDGHGWHSAKNKLNEAFNTIPKLYNLKSITSFIAILKQELI
ncbi:MAG: type II restriction endonuclease [Deltaproteobacteria bacterium]|nr:type II restriction endonuclease [Deltaproteobacteria bacterium]